MAESLPVFTPGSAVTFTASAAITGGQLVAVSGNRTVAPAGAGSSAWIGVAAHDTAETGKVTVYSGGVHELVSSGAVAAGANVIAGAAGVVVTIGEEDDYSKIVGVALSAAASNKVLIKLAR
ncbi:capsid cement protein [Rhodococcus jostii]|uniref:capsid cement protein n=1 Tax=Rhodococcus jostii TaxID=132919 RepID=UPI00364A5084